MAYGLAPPLDASSRAAIRGSVVVITGASSGIGAELAVQYGSLGARVVIGARRRAELEAVAARVRGAGGEAVAVAGDMGVAADCEALIAAAAEHFGGLDTLVVNHAMFDDGMFLGKDVAAIDAMKVQFSVNVMGPAYLIPGGAARAGGGAGRGARGGGQQRQHKNRRALSPRVCNHKVRAHGAHKGHCRRAHPH